VTEDEACRQATNKIVGISDEAAAFLGRFF